MLYGDTFKEQIDLVNGTKTQILAIDKTDEMDFEAEIVQDDSKLTSSAKSIFKHVSNKSNSTLGGTVRDKQMVVMSVAKYDPKMAGTLIGSELIRVFSRSYNALQYVPNAVAVQTYSASIGFISQKSGFLKTDAISPNESNLSLPKGLQVMVQLANASGGTSWQVKALNFILSNVASNSIDIGGNSASATCGLYGLKDWSQMNLPRSTGSSDAEDNTTNGIAFEIGYRSFGNGGTETDATCSASV